MKITNLIFLTTISIFLNACTNKQDSSVNNLNYVKKEEKIINIDDSLYEKERKTFLSETMYSSKIPVKTPDKILRVLLMPYVDEDMNLQTENYHFIKVDEGRWILGEYLNGQDRTKNSKFLTPLENKDQGQNQ